MIHRLFNRIPSRFIRLTAQLLIGALLLSPWLQVSYALVNGQVVPSTPTSIMSDGSQGTSVMRTGTTNGSTWNISGGAIKGGVNQFQSFQNFTVPTNDTAIFNGPAGIQRIISRVT